MLASTATRREFLRYVYDEGGANATTRGTFISTWRNAALEAVKGGGVLVSTSANGNSASFQLQPGWTADTVMDLADWARSYITESTIAASLAEVSPRVTTFRMGTTNLRVLG